MARLSTCKLCGVKLQKEEKYTYSSKTYCKKCYDFKVNEHLKYSNLIKSICSYFSINQPTGLMLKQIKECKEQFNYEYDWITYCLWYVTDILNKQLDKKYGIAIVKYEYENAKEYFNKQQLIKNSMKNIDFKPKEVVKKVKIINANNKNKFLINLDEV